MPVALDWYDVEDGLGSVLPTTRLTLADVLRSHARSRGDALCLGDGDVAPHVAREPTSGSNRVANALDGVGVGARRPRALARSELVPAPGAAARLLEARRDVLPGELAAAAPTSSRS